MTVPAQTLMEAPATTRGGVSEVFQLALPVIASTICETAMQFMDAAMVGHLGTTELGAVGFAGIWIWTLFVPFTGTAQGVQSFVSRHDGANQQERCGPWIWQAIWLVAPAMTLWMVAVAFLFPLLVAFFGVAPEIQTAAVGFGW